MDAHSRTRIADSFWLDAAISNKVRSAMQITKVCGLAGIQILTAESRERACFEEFYFRKLRRIFAHSSPRTAGIQLVRPER
jgi:hypothetical protein